MLAALSLRSVRHTLVILLMILSAFVVAERAHAAIDTVQHELAIDHAAPTVAHAGVDHDLDHDAGDGASDVRDEDRAPASHHHHSEGSQLAALTSPATVAVALSRAEALFMLTEIGSPQSRIFGLERPPKTLSERA